MKVYIYSDGFKRNLAFKTLEAALKRNSDLQWVIWPVLRNDDPTCCIAQTFYKGEKITICELEVFE